MDHRPSATAVLVLRGVAAVAATPELRVVVPTKAAEMAREILSRESRISRWYIHLLSKKKFRTLVFGIERLITPGIFLHFALRKRFIEDAVREAIADGYRQVVILGAGLDTLALRLQSEFPSVAFVEVDHPSSQAAKQRLLPASVAQNLRFLPLDLAAPDLRARLAEFLLAEPQTIFVAEGLTMYLPEWAVRDLFGTLRVLAPEGRVVFSAMEISPKGQPNFRRSQGIVHWWLARRREPLRWGIHRQNVPAFLRSLGFALKESAGAERLRTFLPAEMRSEPLAEGEWIYVTESPSSSRIQ